MTSVMLRATTGLLLLLVTSFLCLSVTEVNGLSCRCTGNCPPVGVCPGGLVSEPCGCCQVCAHMVGEQCGGLWDVSGKCDKGLFCYIPPHIENDDGMATGTCRELFPDCTSTACDTDIDEPCPFASTRHYRMLEPGRCCPRASECRCDDVCPGKPTCLFGHQKPFLMKKGTGRLESCCDEYECRHTNFSCADKLCILWDCPADSKQDMEPDQGEACCPIPTERMCVCDPNDAMLCPDDDLNCDVIGQRSVITHRRISGTPGFCCNKKQCLAEPPKHIGCVVGNVTLRHKGHFYDVRECTLSKCEDGILKTNPIHCEESTCWNLHEKHCCKICQNKYPYEKVDTDVDGLIPVCKDPYLTMYHDVGHEFQLEKGGDCESCVCGDDAVFDCTWHLCPEKAIAVIPGASEKLIIGKTEESVDGKMTIGLRENHDRCPALTGCTLACPRGFESDQHGCRRCLCKKRRRCRGVKDACDKDCPYGYKQSKHCQRCRCNTCPLDLMCPKDCRFGYLLNEFNCMTCRCNNDSSTWKQPPPRNQQLKSASCEDDLGVERHQGERWREGCLNCTCGGGKIYCEVLKCPIPRCDHPVFLEGDCCPYCPDMMMMMQMDMDVDTQTLMRPDVLSCDTEWGERTRELSTWKTNGGCTICLCFLGKVTCTIPKCRPLPCKITIQEPNECCRKCSDVTPMMTSDDLLQLAKTNKRDELFCYDSNQKRLEWGTQWKEDACTSCVCISGMKRCYSSQCDDRQPCDNPVLLPGECCPVCINEEDDDVTTPLSCDVRNKITSSARRKKSESSGVVTIKLPLEAEDCDNCTCVGGQPLCRPLPCPDIGGCHGGIVVKDQFSCCPRCHYTSVVTSSTTISSTTTTSSPPEEIVVFVPMGQVVVDDVIHIVEEDEVREEPLETNQILVAVCTCIIIIVLILLFTFWWKRSKKTTTNKKENVDPYPNVKPQLVEPVSCL